MPLSTTFLVPACAGLACLVGLGLFPLSRRVARALVAAGDGVGLPSWRPERTSWGVAGLCALAAAGVAWRVPAPGMALWSVPLTATMVVLAVTDWGYRILPDILVLPLAGMGLLANGLGGLTTPVDALLGLVGGGGALWLCAALYRWRAGGDGIGGGDIKYLAALGAWLGGSALLPVTAMAALAALVMAAMAGLFRRPSEDVLPFGSFLSLAAWLWLVGAGG